jgi:hypothetical protein
MTTIGDLWLLWLIGLIGSLVYFFMISWKYFAFITKGGDTLENDPADQALAKITLRSFWPLVSAGLFLVLLILAALHSFKF